MRPSRTAADDQLFSTHRPPAGVPPHSIGRVRETAALPWQRYLLYYYGPQPRASARHLAAKIKTKFQCHLTVVFNNFYDKILKNRYYAALLITHKQPEGL